MPNKENLKPYTSENQPPKGSNSRKGIPNHATVFKRLLSIKIKGSELKSLGISDELAELTESKKISLHEATALGQIQEAIKGNPKSFEIIQDSLFGKMTEKTELSAAVEVRQTARLEKLSTDELIELKTLLEKTNG